MALFILVPAILLMAAPGSKNSNPTYRCAKNSVNGSA
jgi:hypothetical protein